jgi:hypothetical protein
MALSHRRKPRSIVAGRSRGGIMRLAIFTAALSVSLVGLSGTFARPAAAQQSPVRKLCISSFPSANQKTTGHPTRYNRQASVQAVSCNGFGFDLKFQVDGGHRLLSAFRCDRAEVPELGVVHRRRLRRTGRGSRLGLTHRDGCRSATSRPWWRLPALDDRASALQHGSGLSGWQAGRPNFDDLACERGSAPMLTVGDRVGD